MHYIDYTAANGGHPWKSKGWMRKKLRRQGRGKGGCTPAPREVKAGTAVGTGSIVYSKLPRAAYSDGECHKCHHYPNASRIMATDEGEKRVVVCGKCTEKMRPFR
ncbi:MAG: hypothetical protein ABSE18_03225 [Minisyncoccia bacterium]|jgi:hypothetical protein